MLVDTGAITGLGTQRQKLVPEDVWSSGWGLLCVKCCG